MSLARLALAALASASLASAALPKLGGINLAGLDFGITTWGWSGSYQAPDISQISHFIGLGANAIRIPFGWQYATGGTVGGELDATFLALIDSYVQETLSLQAYAILDLHNYARWNSGVVGVDGPTNEQFASLWSQLAAKYASDERVIFGLMNEPHDLADLSAWVVTVQAAVDAIRAAGATSQTILLPGNDWTHAASMVSTSGPALLAVTDSAGAGKLVFDVHQYLDSDGSGTQSTCTTDNVDLMTSLNSWLASVDRQALVTETGVPNNADCITKLNAQLSFVKSSSNIAGFTAWSAGAFDPSYLLSLTPGSDGSDNAVATRAVIPNFPAAAPVASGTSRRRRSPEVEARRATYRAYATKRRQH